MSFPAASPGALHQETPGLQFKCKFSCMDKDLLTALRQHRFTKTNLLRRTLNIPGSGLHKSLQYFFLAAAGSQQNPFAHEVCQQCKDLLY